MPPIAKKISPKICHDGTWFIGCLIQIFPIIYKSLTKLNIFLNLKDDKHSRELTGPNPSHHIYNHSYYPTEISNQVSKWIRMLCPQSIIMAYLSGKSVRCVRPISVSCHRPTNLPGILILQSFSFRHLFCFFDFLLIIQYYTIIRSIYFIGHH